MTRRIGIQYIYFMSDEEAPLSPEAIAAFTRIYGFAPDDDESRNIAKRGEEYLKSLQDKHDNGTAHLLDQYKIPPEKRSSSK